MQKIRYSTTCSRNPGWRLALFGAVAGALAGPAFSKQSDTGTDVAAPALEEILVTARRRSESLANVPIAITAVNSQAILERSIRTDSDLQFAVPGLTIRQTQGNNSLTYSIRGQTADTFSGSPSAVIAYMNDVPLTISGSSTFYDLESIQVLKGPQGTLFGRNTTGGAVLYTSAKPTGEFEGMVRVRAGDYDLGEIEGMINVPLVDDKVLLRAAFNTLEQDGYIDNRFDGSTLGDIERDSMRVSLTIAPSDVFENTSVFSYSELDGTNTGASYTYSVYGCGDTNNGVALTCDSGLLFGPGLDSVFGPGAWDAYLAEHPQAYAPGLLAYLDEQRRIGLYETNHPAPARHEGEDWIFTNTTTWDINDNLRLKNILGISSAKTDSEQPQLGAPFVTILTANAAAGQSGNELEVDSFSEELQLHGTSMEGDLTWIAGLYVQRMQTDTLWPQTYFDVSPLIAPSYVTNEFRVENDSDAVYLQGSYDLSGAGLEGVSITAGFRYTWEDVSIEQRPRSTYTFGAPDQDETFEEPAWEVGLEYQASDALFTYIKTRGSFRSGGFNGAAPPVDADATGGGNKFDSETTQDIEAGLKYRGDALGAPASLDIAVYKQWIDDVQRVEFPDPDGPGGLASIAVTANIPEAEIQGVELEASILPASWLELGVNGAWTDAEFTDGEINLFGNPYSYGPVADTPEYTGYAYALVMFPSDPAVGEFRLRGELYAQSSMYFANAADSVAPGTKLPSYELFNARLDWRNIMGSNLSAALWGKNLSDEEYFVGGMTLAAALGHNAAAVGEPRTYGVELTYEF